MAKEQTYTVIVSDRAKRMLASHIRFLANVSKEAAAEKKTQLIREIRSLSKLPHRYPFFEAEFMPANKYHKMFVANCYLILYQIRDDTVYVDYILDCRKDYGWLLQA